MSSPTDASRQIASDLAYAFDLARQEYEAAGLHKQAPASEAALIRSQEDRYTTLQRAAQAKRAGKTRRPESPQPDAPRAKKRVRFDLPEAPSSERAAPPALEARAPRARRAPRPLITPASRGALEVKLRTRPDMLRDVPQAATLVRVRGDGNCGYYTLLAGLVRVALAQVRDLGRSSVAEGFRALPSARNDRLTPECAEGREVLSRYADMIAAGQGEEVIADLESNPAHAFAAHMALRSARASIGDEPQMSRSGDWADSGDLKALALHLGVDANVYSTDRAAFEAAGEMHAVSIAQAGQAPHHVEIVHGRGHYDLLLPNG